MLNDKVSTVAAPPAAAMEPEKLNLHDELPKSPLKSLSSTDTSLSGTDTSFSGGETILLSDDTSLSGTDTSGSNTGVIRLAKSYMDKSIKAFGFNGNTYKVQTWVEMLTTLSDYLASTNEKDFEKVLWISNDQKARFSRYEDQLHIPVKVKRTDIYVETKMNPEEVVRTSCQLLAEFGYDKDDLDIEAT